ncbi:MAG TPA: hypothetical protein VK797_27650 [Tepidisphaeraceae bacterium]|jgi:hypothetical protein|nr:hypothetical protein [Tepidisphaeraceae bacterium]
MLPVRRQGTRYDGGAWNGTVSAIQQVVGATGYNLQILLASLNRTGAWDQGDFNYDGVANSADLQALLFTLNTSLGSQATPMAIAATAAVTTPPKAGSSGTSDPSPNLVPAIHPTGTAGRVVPHLHEGKVSARKRR